MHVVLINPYELGRQPFGLAQPAAWLKDAGFSVRCLDLSLQRLAPDVLAGAGLVAIYVAMHTATRIAVAALPTIRAMAPGAHLCVYGLYAPMNEDLFRSQGVGTVLGGEIEPDLLSLAKRLRDGLDVEQAEAAVNLSGIDFQVPDRGGLPALDRYAHLIHPDGTARTVGFAETTRGCKHLCRHCPVVPVYQGRFRALPVDIVLADIANQVGAGAEHISFGDPDFFNGPAHAVRVVRAVHAEWPHLTYDATIKIEHLVKSADLLGVLKETGCLFITSAVESVDHKVLEYLDKNHGDADFAKAVELLRGAGIALSPTFVPFNPWTTAAGYVDLLRRLVELRLVEAVSPIQLAIRLLVPRGSYLMRLAGFADLLEPFDDALLGYPWHHADPAIDALQLAVQALVERAEDEGLARRDVFRGIWSLAHDTLGRPAPLLPGDLGSPIPRMSEPWYCCAEPTQQQLQSF